MKSLVTSECNTFKSMPGGETGGQGTGGHVGGAGGERGGRGDRAISW